MAQGTVSELEEQTREGKRRKCFRKIKEAHKQLGSGIACEAREA